MILDPSRIGAARRMDGFQAIPALLEEQRRLMEDGIIETPGLSKDYQMGYHDACLEIRRAFEDCIAEPAPPTPGS